MEADEAGTVATTMSHRRELWTPMTEKHIGRIMGIAGDSLLGEFASTSAQASMTKRIRMSEAVQQAKCAKPRGNHAWIAGFVAINGHWAKMTGKLIWINDSIGELWVPFQTAGVLFAKCRLNRFRQPNVLPFSASWRCYLGNLGSIGRTHDDRETS